MCLGDSAAVIGCAGDALVRRSTKQRVSLLAEKFSRCIDCALNDFKSVLTTSNKLPSIRAIYYQRCPELCRHLNTSLCGTRLVHKNPCPARSSVIHRSKCPPSFEKYERCPQFLVTPQAVPYSAKTTRTNSKIPRIHLAMPPLPRHRAYSAVSTPLLPNCKLVAGCLARRASRSKRDHCFRI